MTISVILTPIAGEAGDEHALAAALAVGRQMGAHLRVLHVRVPPSAAVFAGAPEGAMVTAELLTLWESDVKERAQRARARYDSWRSGNGLAEVAAPPARAETSTSWVELEGQFDPSVARQGRVSDLIVLGAQNGTGDSTPFYACEGALFESGRPVLLVPARAPEGLFGTAIVAWNGSAEAAAAVGGALPLLARAKRVHIFSAGERGETGREPEELVDYLGWHGIKTTTRVVNSTSHDVGAALLKEVAEVGAGMLVMGAYTHSRTRQLIFGGATSHVLRHAGIPVLMAH